MKTLQIPSDLHKKLKMKAIEEGKTMLQLLIEIITKYLAMVVLVLFVGCATHYTKGPDEVNAKRYNHDEKIREGMTMKEVMDTFGSPSQVKNAFFVSETVIEFVYYRSIYCESIYCFVHFDKDSKEVVRSINFRQEFTELVKY